MKASRTHWKAAALAALGSSLLLSSAHAGNRHFTYSYETTTMPKGGWELETWATWKNQIADEPGLDEFDFRHEIEYGVTDKFQLGFYLPDWTYSNGPDGSDAEFEDVGIEAIYNLTDPNQSPFGSALYGEVKVGDGVFELEAKFLAQKNIGDWMLVYNIGGELEWEEDFEEDNAELFQSFGASYQINPCWSVGLEALHEIAVPDVESLEDNAFFVGPNVSWRLDRFFVTSTALWQATTLSGEPDFQLRTIVGFEF